MRGTLLTTVISVLFSLGIAACGGPDGLHILVLHQTGDDATVIQQGLTFAVEELNSRDGIGGRPLRLETLDITQGKDHLETVLQEKIRITPPLLIVVHQEEVAHALLTISPQIHIPIITLAELPENTKSRDAWLFCNAITAREEARVIWQLIHQYAPQGITLIHGDTPRENAILREIRARAERDGKSAILHLNPEPTPREAVLLTAAAKELPFILRRLRRTGFTLPIITTSQALHPDIRRLPEAEGVICPASAVDNRSLSLTRRTTDIFFSRFGRDMTIEAALAYDSIVLVSSIAGNDQPDPESLQRALSSETVYPSIFGTRHLPHGLHSTSPTMRPVVLQQGEPEGLSFSLTGLIP